jgi:release factor glutamine methyltransferase
MPPDTIASLLDEGRQMLQRAGIETAALDARILLRETMGCDDADLIGARNAAVTAEHAEAYRKAIERRAQSEPVSKILGWKEFYGRRFKVTRDVLDPRPDTEALVELCLAHIPEASPLKFVDMGSGSGAIAITLACERPLATGVCCDISGAALAIARGNTMSLGQSAKLTFICSDWFEYVDGVFDLIVSNPPYIRDDERDTLARDVRDFDPEIALFGGDDGLKCYRALAAGAGSHLRSSGKLAVEIGFGMEKPVRDVMKSHGLQMVDKRQDLSGGCRALIFERANPADTP